MNIFESLDETFGFYPFIIKHIIIFTNMIENEHLLKHFIFVSHKPILIERCVIEWKLI